MKPKIKPYTLAQLRAALKFAKREGYVCLRLGLPDGVDHAIICAYAIRAKIKERLRDKRRRRAK